MEADVPGADARGRSGAKGGREERTPAHGAHLPALGRHLLREGQRHRDAHRHARRGEQAGSCGGTRAGSTRQNAASSRAALPHARTRAPQGRGPARGGDARGRDPAPDELSEFVSLYWKEKKQPLSAGVKRGLARAFTKFDAYQLAKYDRESAVKIRDVLFLCHAKPKDEAQAVLWKKLVENTLESPDTWEVALSAGKDKRENFERLLREGKLGGMAVLRDLRLMLASGVDPKLIRERLDKGVARALPFRFVTAARHAPKLEDALDKDMLKGSAAFERLAGSTGPVVDVSGSMNYKLSKKGETTRMDAAAGLAILFREKAEEFSIATFSDACVELPPRRCFALRDAIFDSQAHSGTYLKRALTQLHEKAEWRELHRLIVITDEQSHDGMLRAWTPRAYVVNVAPYKHGISYVNGWTHIDGGAESIIDYIAAVEAEAAA